MKKIFLRCLFTLICLTSFNLYGQKELSFPKAPEKPVFSKPFNVALIVIYFDESVPLHPDVVKKNLFFIDKMPLDQFFKTYSLGKTFPQITFLPNEKIVESAYLAPHPMGYFCIYSEKENPMGFKTPQEGEERRAELVENAKKYAINKAGKINGKLVSERDYDIFCFVFHTEIKPVASLLSLIKPIYQNGYASTKQLKEVRQLQKRIRALKVIKNESKELDKDDPWAKYKPTIRFNDPLYPRGEAGFVQTTLSSGGRELVAQVIHALGAPNTERYPAFLDGFGSGVANTPWSFVPGAMSYSRYLHHGFCDAKNFVMLTTSGTYELKPRNGASDGVWGYIVPTRHPHYYYYLEYIYKETPPFGSSSIPEGLLISCLNITKDAAYGAPDMYYVYRPNDPFFYGGGDSPKAIFSAATQRTMFDETTNPASILPTLMPSGVKMTNIIEKKGTLSFNIELPTDTIGPKALKESMLPIAGLGKVTDIGRNYFKINVELHYRGDPLATEFGICYAPKKNPTIKDGKFALHHRDRISCMAQNLKPKTKYYVRAYAINDQGVNYSDKQEEVMTLDGKEIPDFVLPLCEDKYEENAYLIENYPLSSDKNNPKKITAIIALGKLFNFYRGPQTIGHIVRDRKAKRKRDKSKVEKIDFSKMHINPSNQVFSERLETTRLVFDQIKQLVKDLKMDEAEPEKDFVKYFNQVFPAKKRKAIEGFNSNKFGLVKLSELIKNELIQGRIVLICQVPSGEVKPKQLIWRIIDGYDKDGLFHVWMGEPVIEKEKKTGYMKFDDLKTETTDIWIFTNLCF